MKRYCLSALLLCCSLCSLAQDWRSFKFESGDLLFQDVDGELGDAIRAVTPAVKDKHFTHVGIAYAAQDSIWVIEAYGRDVHLTPLREFMNRQSDGAGRPRVAVGRISAEYQNLAGRAVGFALEQRGKPYDHEFEYDNGRYYSSELVFDAFKAAHNGLALFEMEPMSFTDPRTGKTMKAWENYFKEINTKIPKNKPGCNPGSLANDEHVEMITFFY